LAAAGGEAVEGFVCDCGLGHWLIREMRRHGFWTHRPVG
jgi:hypothetical protein